jgi:RNA polymerase sigma factor (sigma-70 family)
MIDRVGAGMPARVDSAGAERPNAAYSPGVVADFDRLYRTSFPRVVRTLAGIVGTFEAAEDCAQEAFARAFRAWADWGGEVPAEAWLHRIAVNTAISHRRREQVRALPSLLRRLGAPPVAPDPADRAETRAVLPALRRLPPKQAAAVILRYYHGYSNREIALALGLSERTIGQRLAAALATLRVSLGEPAPDFGFGSRR